VKTSFKELKDNQVKLTITIDEKEIDERIKKTYKDFSYKYNFPGFRKGKAPRQVVDTVLGAEAVLATVTDEVINESYPLAVDESGLVPISKPSIEEQESMVEAGKPFSFSTTFTKKPDLALSSYDPVEVELPGEEATDEEIQMQVDSMREHYYDFKDAAASKKIEENGYCDIALSATDENGATVEALTSDSRLYALGSGFYPPEFDKHLIGLKKGQKAEFDLEFKGLFTAGLAAVAGQHEKLHFVVEIVAVKEKVLPEVTEEWVKETCGFESIEDLRTRVGESITESKKETLPRLKENNCLFELGDRLQGEVPQEMIDSSEAELYQTFFKQLQGQGLSLDAYLANMGLTIEKFREEIKLQAADTVKQDLALDAWAKNKGLSISEADLEEEFANSGAEDPKALAAEWRSSGRLHILLEGMLRIKAVKDITETAVVVAPGTKKPAAKKAASKKSGDGKSTEKKPAAKAAAKPAAKKAKAEPKE